MVSKTVKRFLLIVLSVEVVLVDINFLFPVKSFLGGCRVVLLLSSLSNVVLAGKILTHPAFACIFRRASEQILRIAVV